MAKSIDSLATYLTQPAKNDFEKARAIYRWITQNISYNFSAYLSGKYGSTKATDVLISRTSVCEGYSALLNAVAKSAGLEVVTIRGWAKGYGFEAGEQITGPTNHAWNAVRIGGGWYLIDSTWGAGVIEQQKFVQDFDDSYFLTPPEQFIYNHFPEDPKWQLLSAPMSKSDFASLPYIHSGFFRYGLSLGDNAQSIIKVAGDLTIKLPTPVDVALTAELTRGNSPLAKTLVLAQRSGNQYQISMVFPSAGDYFLSIYAKRKGDAGDYKGVLEYKVEVSQASASSTGFPETFEDFHTRGAFVYAPLTGHLRPGSRQDFKLIVPGAEVVQIVIGKSWHPLAKQGEQFSGNVPIAAGTVEVCAKFPGNAQYSVLLSYVSR